MKYLILGIVGLFLFACGVSSLDTGKKIEYWKDDRTGLCFASYSFPG